MQPYWIVIHDKKGHFSTMSFLKYHPISLQSKVLMASPPVDHSFLEQWTNSAPDQHPS